jgi:hypothetical protein
MNVTVNWDIGRGSRYGAEEGTADPASTSGGGRCGNHRTRVLVIDGAGDLDPVVVAGHVNCCGINWQRHQEGVATSWNSGANRVTNAAEALWNFQMIKIINKLK